MNYVCEYKSIIGNLRLKSDGKYLTEIMFPNKIDNSCYIEKDDLKIFIKTKKYLDEYFKGNDPSYIKLEIKLEGTYFRKAVWDIIRKIPYGKTMTYGEIAKIMAKKLGKEKMSSQAVGGAVGHNPIPIVIPCHRVVGKENALVGFTGGLDIKKKLLDLEKIKYKE